MKSRVLSALSLLLILSMLSGLFVGCKKSANKGSGNVTDVGTNAEQGDDTVRETNEEKSENTEVSSSTEDGTVEENESNQPSDSDTEDGSEVSETETNPSDEGLKADGEHAELIALSNGLANGVQAYFTDANRTHYSIQNKEMTMTYVRSSAERILVESIKNTKGTSYIENTMDVFVRMKDGNTYYASQSAKGAEANLWRFGYYYYEGTFSSQDFIPGQLEVTGDEEIHFKQYAGSKNIKRTMIAGGESEFIITDANDPYLIYNKDFAYNTEQYNTLVITAKMIGDCLGASLYISVNGNGYNEGQRSTVSFINDGEYHTYYIPLSCYSGYEGEFTGFRLDPTGGIGDGLLIKEIRIGKSDLEGVPQHLTIERSFHVYSDKMHHSVQFAAKQTTTDVAAIGMLTEIDVDRVEKLIVKDKNCTHSSISEVDWASVECIGFDIKDAGIFGIIMPIDESIAGSISVTEKDGKYVIVQELVPKDNTILSSNAGLDESNKYIPLSGIAGNGNDVHLGQRIYTDENHDFEEFLFETYCERNPLTDKQIRVKTESSNDGEYIGYDSLRGIYTLSIRKSPGFWLSYYNPNRNYKVNFNVVALAEDRDIYIMTSESGGCLECAALLDSEMMLLPVPIEVIKNFNEAKGSLFNIKDTAFGEAIFCLSLDKGEKYEYTILNLYQNWGKYPLKQISQIPFHSPYYHLSTGTTETNCILPWFLTASAGKGGPGYTLPDFRSMSAPFWSGQPQHNNGGVHRWLAYTDSEGGYYATESISNTITSYGPTYAEIVMENLSDDGKIKVTYTHMEMPQLDENRTYYTIEYEILEDLTIEDFRHNFQFYDVTDNDRTGSHKRLGYLDESNNSVVVDANLDDTKQPEYLLGDNCPYFTLFTMPDWDRESTALYGYTNLAFLIYNSEFIIGGEEKDADFIIRNPKDYVHLSLDLDKVEFKAGDRMTINAILIPWGSQLYEDGIIDAENGNYEYDMVIDEATGTTYQDKNVRDVRENSLLNPLVVTSETDEIINSPFLPRIKSKDGKSAEFTLSGGENNVAVRVYGFELLTAPKVEELVDGKWITYEISSASTPDSAGYYHYYDGYAVYYDGDGTYSYSFVTTMTEGKSRTFRITAADEFDGWPEERLPEEAVSDQEDLLMLYIDPVEMKNYADKAPHLYGKSVLSPDGDYVSVYVNPDSKEAYTQFIANGDTYAETGNYLVIKYRIPEGFTEAPGNMQIYANAVEAVARDNFYHAHPTNNEWNVLVFDLASYTALKEFTPEKDGKYYAKYLRIDIFGAFKDASNYFDIGFIGMDASLEAICKLVENDFETLTLYKNHAATIIDVKTGDVYKDQSIFVEDSAYKLSDVAYGGRSDTVNGVARVHSCSSAGGYGNDNVILREDGTFNVSGWAAVDGGVEKYLWTIDNGATWHEFTEGVKTPSANAEGKYPIVDAGESFTGKTFEHSREETTVNSSFQGSPGLTVDLSKYEGTADFFTVYIVAVPKIDTSNVCILFKFTASFAK